MTPAELRHWMPGLVASLEAEIRSTCGRAATDEDLQMLADDVVGFVRGLDRDILEGAGQGAPVGLLATLHPRDPARHAGP